MTRITMDAPGQERRHWAESNGAPRRGCCRAALFHAADRMGHRTLALTIATMACLAGAVLLLVAAVSVFAGG